ncbi:hypothetical protein EU527_01045 [Candidatus Thorarchaeota archaeon]|nr:MAG: hypothetical protein EU527_01045 [Candidatus Thorarchaeota archaeon]
MAEQFLSRLNKMEESINQLGETLKRMITILGTVTEIKSEIRVAKDEILQAIANQPAPVTHADNTDEYAKMVIQEVGAVRVFVQESMEKFKNDMSSILEEMVESITAIAATPTPAPATYATHATPAPAQEYETPVYESSSIPADRAMKVADHLEKILDSLKMGCISGDVLEVMIEAKAEIMKIVPSDPIMVKIDKWSGLVSSYPKRNELQARDVIKLKKDLKDEIPKYRPA